MHVPPENIQHTLVGEHQRASSTIAFISHKQQISMQWAANTIALVQAPNAFSETTFYVDDCLSNAAARAYRSWLEESRTEHLLIVPADQYLVWNAFVTCIETGLARAKLGRATYFRRGGGGDVKRLDALTEKPQPLQREMKAGTIDPRLNPEAAIIICIPTLGMTSLRWLQAARQLSPPNGTVTYLAVLQGAEVGAAREMLVDSVLAGKPRAGYMLFLGDDMIPDRFALQRIWQVHRELGDRPAVAGYYRTKTDVLSPIMWRNDKPGLMYPGVDFAFGDLVEVSGTGLDFVLMKTDWVEKVPKPRFQTGQGLNEQGYFRAYTEDAWWWDRASRSTGTRCIVDTSVRIGHYDVKKDVVFM